MNYPFYHAPTTLGEALELKANYGDEARIIAGGTDLLIELERGQRRTSAGTPPGLIDLTRIPGLAKIEARDGWIDLGPLVTHNQCVESSLIVEKAFPLARACWEVGAPQIRNRATVAGNVITASPANDSIVALSVLDTRITLESRDRGQRTLDLEEFITDFRTVDMAPDEILTGISLSAMTPQSTGNFIKLGLRRAQAISVLSVAAVIEQDRVGEVSAAWIALGAVAPVVVRAFEAERSLESSPLEHVNIHQAAHLARSSAEPIDDIRGSAAYRLDMVESLVRRLLTQIAEGRERDGWSDDPVMLWGKSGGLWPVSKPEDDPNPHTLVNDMPVELEHGHSLLESLRRAGIVGVKEGCAEGECGACTLFLDDMAVMSCLVPAERAAGSRVVTVEGLASKMELHPIQEAFVESGGVQCGYCTPGFLMSAAKLLEEHPNPTRDQAREAFAGNLCRCTGYRKILDAVSGQQSKNHPA